MSDAARYNDPEKLEWGRQVSNRNNAKAEEIKALIPPDLLTPACPWHEQH